MMTPRRAMIILEECDSVTKEYEKTGAVSPKLEVRLNRLVSIYNTWADQRNLEPGSKYHIGNAIFPCRTKHGVMYGMAGVWSQKYWITEAWKMVLTGKDWLIQS